MTTNEMIEVMQAHMNGAGIQERPNWDQEEEAWKEVQSPKWNWETTEYRISPAKPALTAEDVLMQMKAIEAKYQKIIEPYDEFEEITSGKRYAQKNFVQAIASANRRGIQDIQASMRDELQYLIKRYPKLALEAGLMYVKEL